MNKGIVVRLLFLVLALMQLAGCGGSSAPPTPDPLSADNLNLIFVASEDLAYQASGDVNPSTANLTNQGLQRSLLTATFLQQKVLGMQNVTEIYALEPMTHLQTANNYPDMVALETIQQFAMLNQVTLSSDPNGGTPYTGQSFPINASYASGPLPIGVAPPPQFCPNCQGIDFNDEEGDNEALLTTIVKNNPPGFYVFSAPWETVSALMANLNQRQGYNLTLPASYVSPNFICAISITPSGSASLITYDSHLTPPSTYPVLPPPPLVSTPCTAQTPFSITVTGGQGGAVIPAGTNTNETLYIIRHADAHPRTDWDDNNYVGAGQWRALDLPSALLGKVSANQVYSIDPAQFGPGSLSASGDSTWSSVAPALTAEPYAIANNLPYNLVSSFQISDTQATSDFFFNGGTLSNQTVLVAWAFQFIQPTIYDLLKSYNAGDQAPPSDEWPSTDYDTIWTVKLDAVGNLTVNNGMCEGIDSAKLPAMPPQF
ncbi:MAG: hypothetical protein P4M04_03935 [Acidobacteriota bacterium]|nr:hypothetical protein [Acidobacteriota bacterium]